MGPLAKLALLWSTALVRAAGQACVNPGFILERHTGQASHGDVCRQLLGNGSSVARRVNFACPSGCTHVHGPPHCIDKRGAELSAVCRVENTTLWPLKPQQGHEWGHCGVVSVMTRGDCTHYAKNSCSASICKNAFAEVGDFIVRGAFIGALHCALNINKHPCGCFFPGLSTCRVDKNTAISTFGDSTMRQFSIAW